MATKIEWTRGDDGSDGEVWNPVRGCARVSTGCEHCYAERMAHRFSGAEQPYEDLTRMTEHGPRWTGRARFVPEMLDRPLRWTKPRRIFVNSMSDLFHDDITNEQIAAVFGVMAVCPQHTFQILTKRPTRMRDWFDWLGRPDQDGSYPLHVDAVRRHLATHNVDAPYAPSTEWPLPNVWLGVSAEDQAAADERIPLLLQTPAAVRWVSAEPLLGPLHIDDIGDGAGGVWKPLAGLHWVPTGKGMELSPKAQGPRLDWVVIGAESGPKARPMRLDWVRTIRDQCVAAHVPLFFKQQMETIIESTDPRREGKRQLVSMPLLDGRRGDQLPRGVAGK